MFKMGEIRNARPGQGFTKVWLTKWVPTGHYQVLGLGKGGWYVLVDTDSLRIARKLANDYCA